MKKTIVSVAKEIYDNMEYNTRNDKSRYCSLKKDVSWMSDIIREAHLDRFPSDDIYDRINTILSVIYEMDGDSVEDDIREALYTIEADIYTYDLTKWLNDNVENVYYLEEAQSYGKLDGFRLLMTAQKIYIQEIGNALISAIVEYIDNIEE